MRRLGGVLLVLFAAADGTVNAAVWRVTRAWAWLTGRDNYALAHFALNVFICLWAVVEVLDVQADPALRNRLVTSAATALAVSVWWRDQRTVAAIRRETGGSAVLPVVVYDHLQHRLLMTPVWVAVLIFSTGLLFRVAVTAYLVGHHAATQGTPRGKSVVRRLADAAARALSFRPARTVG